MLSAPTATVVEPYAVIYEHDPALDKSGDDFAELYARCVETGKVEDLPIKPGEQPTVFYMRHPSGELVDILKDLWAKLDGPNMVAAQTVAYTLCRVENWGADEPVWNGVHDARGHSMVPADTIDTLRLIPGLIDTLATIAWKGLVPSKN